MAVVFPGDAAACAPIHCRRTTSLKTYEARATIVVGIAVPLACLKGGSIDIAGCSVIIYINQLIGIREDAVILVGRRRASASSNATASALAADEALGTLRIIVAISFAQIQGRRSRTSGLNGISWYRRAVVIVDIF